MSTNLGIGGKGEKAKDGKKYSTLDINTLYKGKSAEPQQRNVSRGHGLQSLGKVPVSRRMPMPATLPSLKAENSGNDPNVNLVPGGPGWGAKKQPTGAESGPVAAAPGSSSGEGKALVQPAPLRGASAPVSGNGSSSGASAAGAGAPPGSSAGVGSGGGARLWSSVTQGASAVERDVPGQGSHRFRKDFPSLVDEKEKDVQEKDGGEPSLRPQRVGSWREGGGRNVSQFEREEANNGGSFADSRAEPPYSGGDRGRGPSPSSDSGYGRGSSASSRNMSGSMRARDSRNGPQPPADTRPDYSRPIVINKKKLDELIETNDNGEGWASASGEVDYTAKLIFSDDDDEEEVAPKHPASTKQLPPQEQREQPSRSSGSKPSHSSSSRPESQLPPRMQTQQREQHRQSDYRSSQQRGGQSGGGREEGLGSSGPGSYRGSGGPPGSGPSEFGDESDAAWRRDVAQQKAASQQKARDVRSNVGPSSGAGPSESWRGQQSRDRPGEGRNVNLRRSPERSGDRDHRDWYGGGPRRFDGPAPLRGNHPQDRSPHGYGGPPGPGPYTMGGSGPGSYRGSGGPPGGGSSEFGGEDAAWRRDVAQKKVRDLEQKKTLAIERGRQKRERVASGRQFDEEPQSEAASGRPAAPKEIDKEAQRPPQTARQDSSGLPTTQQQPPPPLQQQTQQQGPPMPRQPPMPGPGMMPPYDMRFGPMPPPWAVGLPIPPPPPRRASSRDSEDADRKGSKPSEGGTGPGGPPSSGTGGPYTEMNPRDMFGAQYSFLMQFYQQTIHQQMSRGGPPVGPPSGPPPMPMPFPGDMSSIQPPPQSSPGPTGTDPQQKPQPPPTSVDNKDSRDKGSTRQEKETNESRPARQHSYENSRKRPAEPKQSLRRESEKSIDGGEEETDHLAAQAREVSSPRKKEGGTGRPPVPVSRDVSREMGEIKSTFVKLTRGQPPGAAASAQASQERKPAHAPPTEAPRRNAWGAAASAPPVAQNKEQLHARDLDTAPKHDFKDRYSKNREKSEEKPPVKKSRDDQQQQQQHRDIDKGPSGYSQPLARPERGGRGRGGREPVTSRSGRGGARGGRGVGGHREFGPRGSDRTEGGGVQGGFVDHGSSEPRPERRVQRGERLTGGKKRDEGAASGASVPSLGDREVETSINSAMQTLGALTPSSAEKVFKASGGAPGSGTELGMNMKPHLAPVPQENIWEKRKQEQAAERKTGVMTAGSDFPEPSEAEEVGGQQMYRSISQDYRPEARSMKVKDGPLLEKKAFDDKPGANGQHASSEHKQQQSRDQRGSGQDYRSDHSHGGPSRRGRDRRGEARHHDEHDHRNGEYDSRKDRGDKSGPVRDGGRERRDRRGGGGGGSERPRGGENSTGGADGNNRRGGRRGDRDFRDDSQQHGEQGAEAQRPTYHRENSGRGRGGRGRGGSYASTSYEGHRYGRAGEEGDEGGRRGRYNDSGWDGGSDRRPVRSSEGRGARGGRVGRGRGGRGGRSIQGVTPPSSVAVTVPVNKKPLRTRTESGTDGGQGEQEEWETASESSEVFRDSSTRSDAKRAASESKETQPEPAVSTGGTSATSVSTVPAGNGGGQSKRGAGKSDKRPESKKYSASERHRGGDRNQQPKERGKQPNGNGKPDQSPMTAMRVDGQSHNRAIEQALSEIKGRKVNELSDVSMGLKEKEPAKSDLSYFAMSNYAGVVVIDEVGGADSEWVDDDDDGFQEVVSKKTHLKKVKAQLEEEQTKRLRREKEAAVQAKKEAAAIANAARVRHASGPSDDGKSNRYGKMPPRLIKLEDKKKKEKEKDKFKIDSWDNALSKGVSQQQLQSPLVTAPPAPAPKGFLPQQQPPQASTLPQSAVGQSAPGSKSIPSLMSQPINPTGDLLKNPAILWDNSSMPKQPTAQVRQPSPVSTTPEASEAVLPPVSSMIVGNPALVSGSTATPISVSVPVPPKGGGDPQEALDSGVDVGSGSGEGSTGGQAGSSPENRFQQPPTAVRQPLLQSTAGSAGVGGRTANLAAAADKTQIDAPQFPSGFSVSKNEANLGFGFGFDTDEAKPKNEGVSRTPPSPAAADLNQKIDSCKNLWDAEPIPGIPSGSFAVPTPASSQREPPVSSSYVQEASVSPSDGSTNVCAVKPHVKPQMVSSSEALPALNTRPTGSTAAPEGGLSSRGVSQQHSQPHEQQQQQRSQSTQQTPAHPHHQHTQQQQQHQRQAVSTSTSGVGGYEAFMPAHTGVSVGSAGHQGVSTSGHTMAAPHMPTSIHHQFTPFNAPLMGQLGGSGGDILQAMGNLSMGQQQQQAQPSLSSGSQLNPMAEAVSFPSYQPPVQHQQLAGPPPGSSNPQDNSSSGAGAAIITNSIMSSSIKPTTYGSSFHPTPHPSFDQSGSLGQPSSAVNQPTPVFIPQYEQTNADLLHHQPHSLIAAAAPGNPGHIGGPNHPPAQSLFSNPYQPRQPSIPSPLYTQQQATNPRPHFYPQGAAPAGAVLPPQAAPAPFTSVLSSGGAPMPMGVSLPSSCQAGTIPPQAHIIGSGAHLLGHGAVGGAAGWKQQPGKPGTQAPPPHPLKYAQPQPGKPLHSFQPTSQPQQPIMSRFDQNWGTSDQDKNAYKQPFQPRGGPGIVRQPGAAHPGGPHARPVPIGSGDVNRGSLGGSMGLGDRSKPHPQHPLPMNPQQPPHMPGQQQRQNPSLPYRSMNAAVGGPPVPTGRYQPQPIQPPIQRPNHLNSRKPQHQGPPRSSNFGPPSADEKAKHRAELLKITQNFCNPDSEKAGQPIGKSGNNLAPIKTSVGAPMLSASSSGAGAERPSGRSSSSGQTPSSNENSSEQSKSGE